LPATFSLPNFKTDVEAILRATLPEETTLWRMDQAIRGSWEERETPYFVHECSPMEDADWGAVVAAYEWDWTGHYVARSSVTIEEVWSLLEEIKAALYVANQGTLGYPLSGVTLLRATPDESREAEVNEIFYGKNAPFVGGAIRARFVGGTTAT
jgi:hypothetical protein